MSRDELEEQVPVSSVVDISRVLGSYICNADHPVLNYHVSTSASYSKNVLQQYHFCRGFIRSCALIGRQGRFCCKCCLA
jgi:hypothetical protein